jgi:hypothetical protein
MLRNGEFIVRSDMHLPPSHTKDLNGQRADLLFGLSQARSLLGSGSVATLPLLSKKPNAVYFRLDTTCNSKRSGRGEHL